MIRFDIETWKKRPDLYPMVLDNPFLGGPVIKSEKEKQSRHELERLFKLSNTTVLSHGDILVTRADGSWHAMPEDVYRKIRRELDG